MIQKPANISNFNKDISTRKSPGMFIDLVQYHLRPHLNFTTQFKLNKEDPGSFDSVVKNLGVEV